MTTVHVPQSNGAMSFLRNWISKVHHTRILFLLLGMFGGYLILHPYSMLVYALTHIHETQGLHIHLNELWLRALTAFKPTMAPMAISFVLFGGSIGFLIGIIIDRRRKLLLTEHENEKRKVALETLKEFIVTLSHHLLNANMIIGGKVRHCRKGTSSKDILAALEVIEEQGRKIDAVIKTLREVSEIKTIGYTTSEEVKMIDIAKEVENSLQQSEKMRSS